MLCDGLSFVVEARRRCFEARPTLLTRYARRPNNITMMVWC
jgi:hypothetical protein